MLAAGPAAAERHRDHAVDRAEPVDQLLVDHPTSQTGSGVSTTSPSPRNSTNRSKVRVNHLSCVTATTVPSNAVSPASSASAEARSRLSVGSSSSSSVAPDSSSRQHQEAGLLAAGERAEALVALAGQLVAGQRRHGRVPVHAGPVVVAAPQHLDKRLRHQLRAVVGL